MEVTISAPNSGMLKGSFPPKPAVRVRPKADTVVESRAVSILGSRISGRGHRRAVKYPHCCLGEFGCGIGAVGRLGGQVRADDQRRPGLGIVSHETRKSGQLSIVAI